MPDNDEIRSGWRNLGRQLAALRKAAGHTQHSFARLVQYGRSTVANTEIGHQQPDRAFWERCDELLHSAGSLAKEYDRVASLAQQQRRASAAQAGAHRNFDSSDDLGGDHVRLHEETLRRRVDEALGHHNFTSGCLDDWEQTVSAHARATRYRPAAELLADLLADTDELYRLLSRRNTASTLRRTTRLTAQMAGLISLTLLKLNIVSPSRAWARTARVAAAETADRSTMSWVWAQDAYRFFYTGDYVGALATATRAQQLAGPAGGVGAVLAAALEARAQASLGRAAETTRAIDRAEAALGRLRPDQTAASAFGYDEAQLRFHAGNAYTHLGDTASAWTAQDQALQLYPAEENLDRSLIRLDRAACLIRAHDIQAAGELLADVLTSTAPGERTGLLLSRARDVIRAVPEEQRTAGALRDIYDLLSSSRRPSEELGP